MTNAELKPSSSNCTPHCPRGCATRSTSRKSNAAHRTAKRRGKSATKSKSTKADKALALYLESPPLQLVNTLLHALMDRANTALPTAFRTVPVNLFGKASNRLDPLGLQWQKPPRRKAARFACREGA